MKIHSKILILTIPFVVASILAIGTSALGKMERIKFEDKKKAEINSLNRVKNAVDEINAEIKKKLSFFELGSNIDSHEDISLNLSKGISEIFHDSAELQIDVSTASFLNSDFSEIASAGPDDLSSIAKNIDFTNESSSFQYIPAQKLFVQYLATRRKNGTVSGYVAVSYDSKFIERLFKKFGIESNIILSKADGQSGLGITVSEKSIINAEHNLKASELSILSLEITKGLFIGSIVKKDENSTLLTFFIFISCAAITLSIGGFVAMKAQSLITIRITSLEKASKKISDGNYIINIDDNEDDEISSLSRSFQGMCNSLKESNEKNIILAYYDELTGLPNRRNLNEKLIQSVKECNDYGQKMCMMLFDLDDFKNINDAFGHHVGDMLLVEIGKILSSEVSHFSDSRNGKIKCISSRLAGDEFAILLHGIESKAHAGVLAGNILSKISSHKIIDGKIIAVNASMGIVQYPIDGSNPEDLFKNCDMSMYEAKKNGKNNYVYFDEQMKQNIMLRLKMEKDIWIAVKESQFSLYFQPKVDLTTGAINKFEALVRWTHPSDGAISPNIFIPFAEETGQVKEIGRWVIDSLCEHIKIMEKDDRWGKEFVVSFNASSHELQDVNFVRYLKSMIKAYNINPKHIEVEITEHSLVRDLALATETLSELKKMGISISLDDFGTGYSSLSYLENLPVDTIKIDRSFVEKAVLLESSKTIIRTITVLAKGLGMSVVAEGIENEKQLELIVSLGCECAQGYYFHKPMPFVDLHEIELNLKVD